MNLRFRRHFRTLAAGWSVLLVLGLGLLPTTAIGQTDHSNGSDGDVAPEILAKPGLFEPLTEPPCSYCSTQHTKGLVRNDDVAVAWIRGPHNGGAIPARHFLARPRVINDTYGLFFYDPDGGYIAAYEKDYGYHFYGWHRGAMVVQGPDGSLWSAVSGRAMAGPRKGDRLRRVPSLVTTWGYWLMLHPESTAYDLFDGSQYPPGSLPAEMTKEAKETMGSVDDRLPPDALVIGVEHGEKSVAFPLNPEEQRACHLGEVDQVPVAVFWYGPTKTAAAYRREVKGRTLTFHADGISPESAPFKDRETGTRWTVAGRAVDGPLRGEELTWIDSIQCRWYAWSAEYPETQVHESPQ